MKGNYRKLVEKINQGKTVNVRHLGFREINGFKSIDDKILQINSFGNWINLTFKDLLTILKFWFENEERVYNKPSQKGKQYVLEVINKLSKGYSIEELLSEFGDKHTS